MMGKVCPTCGGKPYRCCDRWFDEDGIREHLTLRLMTPETIDYHIANPDCPDCSSSKGRLHNQIQKVLDRAFLKRMKGFSRAKESA